MADEVAPVGDDVGPVVEEVTPVTDNTTPVLIYASGLGRYAANSADAVAEVLAQTYDRLDPANSFSTSTSPKLSAPRGLRVSKTIADASDTPVLQLFELDYMPALDPPADSVADASSIPGLFRSFAYAAWATWSLVRALHRPAKKWRTKTQIAAGFLVVG